MTTAETSPSVPVLFEEEIPGGAMWSYALKRYHTLRLTDLQGGVNVGAMLYRLDHPLDRLNLPDTLKAQHTAKLTTGNVLLSDMGHALCSISAARPSTSCVVEGGRSPPRPCGSFKGVTYA